MATWIHTESAVCVNGHSVTIYADESSDYVPRAYDNRPAWNKTLAARPELACPECGEALPEPSSEIECA